MSAVPDTNERTESALYWSAVSLIVCEGLPLEKAADRLGVDSAFLCSVVCRRRGTRLGAPPVEIHAGESDTDEHR